jgi:hypothetical protein
LLHSIGITAQQQVWPLYQVLLTSFAIVAVLLCIGTAIFGANDAAGVGEIVGTILMVATTLVTSLLCAVYPKQHFAFANVNAFGRLPYRFFAVAGLTAAAAAFVIGLALRMLIYQDAEKALLLANQRTPFLLVSCTFAVLMALLVQDTDELASASTRTAHRWRDTYVLALGGTAAGAAATLLLRYTDPNKPVSVWAGAFVGLIGGTLGYLVPHRFRNVCPQPHPGRAGIPEIEPEKITEPVVSASTPSSSASTETLRSH